MPLRFYSLGLSVSLSPWWWVWCRWKFSVWKRKWIDWRTSCKYRIGEKEKNRIVRVFQHWNPSKSFLWSFQSPSFPMEENDLFFQIKMMIEWFSMPMKSTTNRSLMLWYFVDLMMLNRLSSTKKWSSGQSIRLMFVSWSIINQCPQWNNRKSFRWKASWLLFH